MDETVTTLQTILQAKGVTLFVQIDHSGEAEKAGKKMRPTKLLIFGSPKAGTPLMLGVPSIAIDLPLKILRAPDFFPQPDKTSSGNYCWELPNLPQWRSDSASGSFAALRNPVAGQSTLAR